jgi:hypothetical protein
MERKEEGKEEKEEKTRRGISSPKGSVPQGQGFNWAIVFGLLS